MKIVDIADQVFQELGEPSTLSIPAISYWLRANVGRLNSAINSSYSVSETTYEIHQKINDKERREIILQKLFQLAERGDLRAIQFIVERMEGKALERQERTTKNEPIQVMVIND